MDVCMATLDGVFKTFKNVNKNWSVKTSVIRKEKPSTVRQYKIAMDKKWKEIEQKKEELLKIEDGFVRHALEVIFKGKTVKFTGFESMFETEISEKDRANCRRNLGLTAKLKTLEFGNHAISFFGKTISGINIIKFNLYVVSSISLKELSIEESTILLKNLGASVE